MNKRENILKKASKPAVIIFTFHKKNKPFTVNLCSRGIFFSFIFFLILSGYIALTASHVKEFFLMKDKLSFYAKEFISMRDTINALKKSEVEFNKLLSYKTKEQIYENIDTSDTGSVDIKLLKEHIEVTVERVGDIKDYIRQQRDIYFATPMGWPVDGYISSSFAYRTHPKTKKRAFHGGVDIASHPNNPVRSTADGIVLFADWSGKNGKLVVIRHGYGFTTCYAHNKKIMVTVGKRVKRGDIIAHVGSTGDSTGPHVHYEVWIDGKRVNPKRYL